MRRFRAGVLVAGFFSVLGLAASVAGAEARVAWIELEGELTERPGPFDWLTGGGATTLTDLVAIMDEINGDEDIDGVVLRLRGPQWNAAQVAAVGRSLRELRDAGKKVHAFSDMYEAGALRIASYADEVLMQQGGAVFFPGLYMEEMFLADALEMVGVKADYVQVGDYKGANEMFMNSEPSTAWEENISQLLDSLYGAMRDEMRTNRGMTDAQLDRAMESAWYADGATARNAGLIDGELDRLDLTDHLEAAYGEDVRFDLSYDPSRRSGAMDVSNPFALLQMLSEDPKNEPSDETIAVVHIDGPIVDGESQPSTAFGGGSVGAITIREALNEIAGEDLVKGVVVRVNSPGGSAIASENIWQGVRKLAETKPVWVSVGSMAASGGYYIAVAGDRIFVDDSSIVGSIGVVGGKLALEGVYEMAKVNVVGRGRGPNASMFASGPTWTTAQRDLVRTRMKETYDLFTSRVVQGRDGIELSETAEGRLFAGQKAVDLRMADEVGGLHEAMDALAVELALEGYDVLHYPGPQSFETFIENLTGSFGMAAETPLARAAREILGEEAWRAARDALGAMMELRREPVLLTTPRALIFR